MGVASGTGVAATLYSGNAVADTLLRTNSNVRDAVKNAATPEMASQVLTDLGVTDTTVLNNVLNSTYDTLYVSTKEAEKIFADQNPDYQPTHDSYHAY